MKFPYIAYNPKYQKRNKWICIIATYLVFAGMIIFNHFFELPLFPKLFSSMIAYTFSFMVGTSLVRWFPWMREMKHDSKYVDIKDPNVPHL